MKITKKTVALLLCLAILFSSIIPLVALASPTPPIHGSPWAQDYVSRAIEEGLVPENLQRDYTQPITRAEFSALAVRLYEIVKSEITGRVTFADTNDVNVEKMAYLEVVNGVGDNRFNPNGTLTRQQAAVMLTRLADVMWHPFPSGMLRQRTVFNDMDSVATWAVEGVTRAHAAGIMGGVGDNTFAPDLPYTREQSIVTMMRMLDMVNANNAPLPEIPGVTPGEIPTNHSPTYEVGRVFIVVNDVEHEPYSHFSHGVTRYMSASGPPLMLERVAQELEEIEFVSGLEIVVYGQDASSVSFTLFDENFHALYEFEDSFTPPTEAGVFFICVDVVWGDVQLEATMMRYVFKIRVD